MDGVTRIRPAGTSAPRRLFLGSDESAAQSRGEWPGSRITLREPARCAGARVLLVGLLGGARRQEAAEGGGRKGADALGLGGTRNCPGLGGCRAWCCGRVGGRGGGGVIREEPLSDFGRGGAGIADAVGFVDEEQSPFDADVPLLDPSSKLISGTGSAGVVIAVAFGVVCGDSASERVLSEIVVLSAS